MGVIEELNLKAGVITGDNVLKVSSRLTDFAYLQLFQYARTHQFAIPAIVSAVIDRVDVFRM